MQEPENENDVFDRIMANEPDPLDKPPPSDMDEAAESFEAPPDSGVSAFQGADESVPAEQPDDKVDLATLPPSVQRMLTEANELRDKHLRLTQDYAAVHGRLAPAQRRLAELEKKITESGKAQPGPITATPSQAETTAATVGMTLPEWENYARDFPNEARAVEVRLKRDIESFTQSQQGRIDQLEHQLQAFVPVIQQAHQQAEVAALQQAHPDWQEINQQSDFWTWVNEWVEGLPRNMAEHVNLDRDLNRAEFVVPLLSQYKRFKQLAVPAPVPRPAPARSAVTRLAAAPDMRGTAAPRRVDPSTLDPNDVFDQHMARLQRSR